jgi:hypothetical protein
MHSGANRAVPEVNNQRGAKMQWKVACSVVLLGLSTGAAVATPIYVDSGGREWLDVNGRHGFGLRRAHGRVFRNAGDA